MCNGNFLSFSPSSGKKSRNPGNTNFYWSAANGGLKDGGKGLFPPFSGFSRCSSAPPEKGEKGRKRAKKADFGWFPGGAARHPLSPHLLHPHLRQPNFTWSRPQSEFQVINFFPCRGGCGESFGSCVEVTNLKPFSLGKWLKEYLPPNIHRVFHAGGRGYWPRGSTGVQRYGCIPRSAANKLGEIPKKLGAPNLLFWRVFGWRERFGTRPC